MTQEEKDLLLKDLCARIPYSVKCQKTEIWYSACQEIEKVDTVILKASNLEYDNYEFYKPYLLPLKSITDEQKYELHFFGFYLLENDETNKLEIINYIDEYAMPYGDCNHQNCYELIDWLNKHHIDYRGLIDKGLAIDATNLNIY